MDVRRKQLLCLERRPLDFTLSLAVSAHVISIVSRFLIKKFKRGIFEIKSKDAPRFSNVV